MPSVNVNATAAVYVDGTNSTTKAKNYAGQATFRVGTSPQVISYLYFNLPFPVGANIASARLEITQSQPNTGNRSIDARRVDKAWQNNKVTHNNRPGVTGASSSTSIGSGPRGRVISIDVTTLMQEVSDGAAWYGLRIYTDGAATMHFFNQKSAEFGPRLFVEYSTAPNTPTGLSPSGGRAVSVGDPVLSWVFSAPDASPMVSFQVQGKLGSPDFFTPDFDTGEVLSSIPQWQVAPGTVSPGQAWFWRVRVKNDSGDWSEWSDPAEFTRTNKGVLSITSPAGNPGVVADPTPPVGWSFSGNQTRYRVIVTRIADSVVMWDSGEVSGADSSVIYPDTTRTNKVRPIEMDTEYGLTVRVWDDVDRIGTSGDPAYVEDSTVFTYEPGPTAGPSDLVASSVPGDPRVTLSWTRSTTPDEWIIRRDGKQVARVLGPDLIDSGTSYEFVDLTAASGDHTWTVAAIVNGVTSADNPSASASVSVEGVWLFTLDGEHALGMAGGPPRLDAQEVSTVHLPLGAANPVLITQAVFGRRGRFSGLATERLNGASLAKLRATWEAVMDREKYPRGTVMQLAWTDTSIPVFLFNAFREAGAEYTGSIPVNFDFCEIVE